MNKVVHYISAEWDSKYIIAITKCGKNWEDVDDSSSIKEVVTCKNCLKKINNR